MDELLQRLDQLDHYELLGVQPEADDAALQQAFAARTRRYDPAYAPPSQRALFERAMRAIEGAFAVLSDPSKRQRYDASRRGSPPTRSSSLSDFTWVAAASPAPAAAPPPRTPSAEVRLHGNADPKVDALHATMGRVLSEVERLAAAVHLLVAQVAEPGSVRRETLLAAAETLTQTRATLAALQAEREETAGHFAQAAALWQRVARQRPGDATPYMRACDALRKGSEDLAGAEAMAQKALEVDPDLAEAHAAVAVIRAIRARRSGAR